MHINKLIVNYVTKFIKNQSITLPLLVIVFGLLMFWFDAAPTDFLTVLLCLSLMGYLFHLKANPEPPIISFLNTPEHFKLPEYKTMGASGMDVYYVKNDTIEVNPLERVLIPTGLFISIPEGYELQVRPRSGLAWEKGITVLNSPGTIDCDYTGEIKIILVNHSKVPFSVSYMDSIAQLVLCKVEKAKFDIVDVLPPTKRGDGGFGHTNKL